MTDYKVSLKSARVNAGLTQSDVATAIHKNKSTICDWENGKRSINADTLQRLCELYHVPSMDYIALPRSIRETMKGKKK